MEEFEEKPVVYSRQYAIDTDDIFTYGTEIFGNDQAVLYENFIDKITSDLASNYWCILNADGWLPKGAIIGILFLTRI